jgi:hypothetical protein
MVLVLLAGLDTPPAAAQAANPGPPGPFVLDVRVVSSGLPGAEAFYPTLPAGTAVPTRGLGGSVGAHVFALHIGPARLGFGADLLFARGSSGDATGSLTTVAPQVSFNFGSSDGWSYLSAGLGPARVTTEPGVTVTVRSTNVGGGARWFLGPHLGVGFDVRFHIMAAGSTNGVEVPGSTAVSAAVGLSLR